MYSFYYGANINYVDITDIVYEKCVNDNVVDIPFNDFLRSNLFTDVEYGSLKSIIVVDNFTDETKEYLHDKRILFNLDNGFNDYKKLIKPYYNNNIYNIDDPKKKLSHIHSILSLKHGSLMQEYPEQLLATTFLDPNAKVLELGGNIGRNSCVMSLILNDDKNLVVVEPSKFSSSLLIENRDLNGMYFNVERSAISNISLIQNKWKTIPGDVVLPGYTKVNTISFSDLEKKYDITFDTLVCDCEGALYYILMNDPDMMKNINMVIIENDYDDINHKIFVDDVFQRYGLECVYNEEGGWGPCYSSFYQVFKK